MTHHIPCLYDVDTRAVTRAIRKHGVMKGIIVPETTSREDMDTLMATVLDRDQITQVSTKKIKELGNGSCHVAVMY